MADIEGQVTMVTVAHMMQTHDDDEVVSDSDTPNTSAVSSGSSNTFSDLGKYINTSAVSSGSSNTFSDLGKYLYEGMSSKDNNVNIFVSL